MKKVVVALLIASFAMVGCKKENKKQDIQKEVVAENVQEASFKISGMTCEVGCAKTIESKLAKKEGVVDAKVVFTDSVATVKFDASKTNKKDLMTFVNGIADGKTYTTCEKDCKKSKKECSSEKKECDSKKKEAKKCGTDCKCEGCNGLAKCGTDCEKKCCAEQKETACSTDCKKECCAKA